MQVPVRLAGCQVYQVQFDYQTALLLVRQDDSGSMAVSARLTIETPFVLQSRDGLIYELDPGTSRSALAPVIDLFLATVARVAVEGAGTLSSTSRTAQG